jgi:hypothetical protein
LGAGFAVRWRTQDGAAPSTVPRIIVWSEHALVKARLLGVARSNVRDAILDGHRHRVRNTGAADWCSKEGALRSPTTMPWTAMR